MFKIHALILIVPTAEAREALGSRAGGGSRCQPRDHRGGEGLETQVIICTARAAANLRQHSRSLSMRSATGHECAWPEVR